MSYSERAYFESDHCRHCAAYDDSKLAAYRAKRDRATLRGLADRRARCR